MAQFTNQASLTYNNVTTNSNVATGELLEVISATKTAVTPSYSQGSAVTYAISIVNSGTTAINGLTVSDDLGAYTQDPFTLVPLRYEDGSIRLFTDGVLQPVPTVTATNPLTVTGINIPAGGNVLILYEAVVTEFAPLEAGSIILNTAQISGGGISTPVSATATVTPAEEADLSITKSICPAVVTENSRVTYTFVIQNNGNTAAIATDNASVTDLFNPILTDLAVTLNGQTLSEGSGYTYDLESGLFTTVPGVITVPAATYSTDPQTGALIVTPGVTTLTVTGTV